MFYDKIISYLLIVPKNYNSMKFPSILDELITSFRDKFGRCFPLLFLMCPSPLRFDGACRKSDANVLNNFTMNKIKNVDGSEACD